MILRNGLFSIIAIFGLHCSSAHGYVGTPTLVTTNPVAGQPIQLAIPIGQCDGYFVTERLPEFARTGQTIRVDATTRDWPTCNFPSGLWTFPVGSYEQATYEIQLYETHVFAFTGYPPITTLIGTFPINVAAGTPAATPVPVGGPVFGAVLTILLLLAASLRRRNSGSRFAMPATARYAIRR